MFSCPPSSPASSPSFGPSDSSPPSSPNFGAADAFPTYGSPGLSHPYAASTKANKRPKLYERHDRGTRRSDRSSPDASPDQAHTPTHVRTYSSNSTYEAPLIHPFAASAKASWRPPRREAKYARTDSTASSTSTEPFDLHFLPSIGPPYLKSVSTDDDMLGLTDDESMKKNAVNTSRYRQSAEELKAREKRDWDAAITEAFDNANGVVDLSHSSLHPSLLTYIPPSSIDDLARLVVLKPSQTKYYLKPAETTASRPFTRAITYPASSAPMGLTTSIAKSSSFNYNHVHNSVAPGVNEIHLYLAGNRIQKLPLELFTLQGLTVLSLRANQMRTIPPQIAQLTNLRELNLSQNHLRWLPSEMLDMNISNLILTNNPWLSPPSEALGKANKPVSNTVRRFTIPSLREICMRVLLGPAEAGTDKTVLELYDLPLDQNAYPSEILDIFRACVPKAIARHSEDDDSASSYSASPTKGLRRVFRRKNDAAPEDEWTDPPDIGLCRSPRHVSLDGGWLGGRKPVFVCWAEERYTWEKLGGAETMLIPVRWRGCGRGCLDFLQGENVEDAADEEKNEPLELGLVDKASGSSTDQSGLGVQDVDVGVGVGGWADMEEFE